MKKIALTPGTISDFAFGSYSTCDAAVYQDGDSYLIGWPGDLEADFCRLPNISEVDDYFACLLIGTGEEPCFDEEGAKLYETVNGNNYLLSWKYRPGTENLDPCERIAWLSPTIEKAHPELESFGRL